MMRIFDKMRDIIDKLEAALGIEETTVENFMRDGRRNPDRKDRRQKQARRKEDREPEIQP